MAASSAAPLALALGPVLGLTTSSSTVVLAEFNAAASVTAVLAPASAAGAASDSARRSALITCTAGVPAAFVVSGLAPGTAYSISFEAAGGVTVPSPGRVSVPSTDEAVTSKIGVVSCNKAKFSAAAAESDDMWGRMLKEHTNGPPFTLLLHLGDQVYADADGYKVGRDRPPAFDSAYAHARDLVEGAGAGRRDSVRDAIVELYRNVYRVTWRHKPTAQLMATVPSLMILDDHEVRDDFGDRPEDRDSGSDERFIAECGRQVYYEYQRQLWDPTIMGRYAANPAEPSVATEFHAHEFGSVGVMFVDVRASRAWGDAPKGADAESRLGDTQWAAIRRFIGTAGEGGSSSGGAAATAGAPSGRGGGTGEIKTLVFASTMPLVMMPGAVADAAAVGVDDALGLWGASAFCKERGKLLTELLNWKGGGGDNEIIVVGGDVHMAGFTSISAGGVTITQMTASPVANDTTTGVIGMMQRGMVTDNGAIACTDGAHFHHDRWFIQPNYGVLSVHTGASPGVGMRFTATIHLRDDDAVTPKSTEPGCCQRLCSCFLCCFK